MRDSQGSRAPFSAFRFVLRLLVDVLTTAVPAVLIALCINVFVAQAMVIDGPSMRPNLEYDQRIIVEKVSYLFHGPRRGDVVVIDVSGEPEPLVKRVVGMPGETITMQDGRIYIDGALLNETWAIQAGGADLPPLQVPPHHVFVLGDNRGSSRDSRAFGPVPIDQILGRAWVIYWPPYAAQVIR
ncbi:MAG: signal peptidase I [Anaerolineae bacterium]|nr:signal peptidase I [Anaerolineae bacterium]